MQMKVNAMALFYVYQNQTYQHATYGLRNEQKVAAKIKATRS